MASPVTIRSFRGQQAGAGRAGNNFGWVAAVSSGGRAGTGVVTTACLPSSSPPARKEPYLTLGIDYGATVHDIKQAYRRLARQFHPDVCKGESCASTFVHINNAYETVMGFLKGDRDAIEHYYCAEAMSPEPMMGVYDEDWDEWEEWMGWEGAGTLDFSNHITKI